MSIATQAPAPSRPALQLNPHPTARAAASSNAPQFEEVFRRADPPPRAQSPTRAERDAKADSPSPRDDRAEGDQHERQDVDQADTASAADKSVNEKQGKTGDERASDDAAADAKASHDQTKDAAQDKQDDAAENADEVDAQLAAANASAQVTIVDPAVQADNAQKTGAAEKLAAAQDKSQAQAKPVENRAPQPARPQSTESTQQTTTNAQATGDDVQEHADGKPKSDTGHQDKNSQAASTFAPTRPGDAQAQATTTLDPLAPITNASSTSSIDAASHSQTPAPQTHTVSQAQQAQPIATPNTADAQTPDNLNASRIARALTGAVRHPGGSVTIRMTPPDLGTVRIELQVQNGSVTAQFHAEHDSVRSLLSQRMGQLHQALESQGLSVGRLHVQNSDTGGDAGFNQQREGFNAPNDGRSRGNTGQHRDAPSSQPGDSQAAGRNFNDTLAGAAT